MKNLNCKLLSVVGILIMLMGLTPAQPVQAVMNISTNTTWSGVVSIVEDVQITSGATLTITPGTEVRITEGVDIKIDVLNGSLVADGVTFKHHFGNQWTGIRVFGNADIRNSVILNANTGILVDTHFYSGNVTIIGNQLSNLRGKLGEVGSAFGKPAYGIYVVSGSPEISNNMIHDILSGNGLAGTLDIAGGVGGQAAGIYVAGLGSGTEIFNNTITNVRGGSGGAGYNGSPDLGEHGSWGGDGGIAYGIHIQGDSFIQVVGNHVYDIQSGYGGQGGHGGSGLVNDHGGWGGAGGHSGTAFGIRVGSASDLNITGNKIENIRAGIPGLGGNAGVGNGTGNGGVGGRGGNGGNVYGFSLQNSDFDPRMGGFNANQIFNIIGETGRNGGSGGAGGASGNGGQGGNGGHSSVVRALNFSCVGVDPCPDPGPIVNNVVANVDAKRGGDGGPGGTGGTGGNGGNGGDTRLASLLYFDKFGSLTITNNTLYGAISSLLAGGGGLKGGASANDGSAGERRIPTGIFGRNGNYFIYNNIIVQMSSPLYHGYGIPDGYGIYQDSGGKITANRNTLNAPPDDAFWTASFYHVYDEGEIYERPPGFIDPDNLNFRLNADSNMIDSGDGRMPETPETDIVGRPRPHGLNVDLGAYEFYFVNQPPYFTSTEVTEAIAGRWYSYQVEASDPNSGRGEQLIIYATTLPRWLTLVDHGDGTATLSGQPGSEHLGDHAVWLVVQDWDGETDEQRFLIEVNELSPPPAFSKNMPTNGAVDQPTSQMLSWQNTAHIDKFEYCLGSVSGTCDITGWTNIGTATSVMISIAPDTTNFWQVRAINAAGTTYANNGDWWSFTTVEGQPQHSIFLPLILR